MAFGRIPLNFEPMRRAYKFHNRINDGTPVGREVDAWIKKQNALEAQKGLRKSTTCCMQASMGFNVTTRRIPQAGASWRNNARGEETGLYYILAVSEFRAWLTYTFGPTDQVKTKDDVPDYCPGVLIFGDAHIEFWDGDDVLQAPPLMSGPWMWSQKPIWFWFLSAVVPGSSEVLPDWLVGWWEVYDGNYYYYYFNPSGLVIYIEQRPNPKWTPPATTGNQGQAKMGDHGPVVSWRAVGGLQPTVETFTQLNWTSETQMNGTSTAYAPLFARKMS